MVLFSTDDHRTLNKINFGSLKKNERKYQKKNRSCFDIYITFNESIQLITLLLSFYAKVQVIDDADATVPYSLHSTPSEYAEPKKIKLKIALSPRGFVTNH